MPTARRSLRKNARRPDGGSDTFLSNVMGKNCIVAYGDWRKPLAKYCVINGIRLVK